MESGGARGGWAGEGGGEKAKEGENEEPVRADRAEHRRLPRQRGRVEALEHLRRARRALEAERRRHPVHRRAGVDLAQRDGAVALGQPRAVGAEHERHVRVRRLGQAEQPREPAAGAASSRPGRRRARPRRCPAPRRRPRRRGCRPAAPSLRRTTKSSTTPRTGPSTRSSKPIARASGAHPQRRRPAPGALAPALAVGSAAGTSPGRRPRAAGRAAPRRPRGSRRGCRSTRRRARRPAAADRLLVGVVRADWKTTSPSQSSPIARRSSSCSVAEPGARGPGRGPPSAPGSARPPSGRTATPAAPCAGCRRAGPRRARGEAAVRRHAYVKGSPSATSDSSGALRSRSE